MIRHLGLSGFFLLHRDMLELAREVAAEVRGPESSRRLLPPGRGRGSSVSSIVCYLTGLSHVDPIANELLLGRFLNEELTALPDIDLDFPRDIRDVLIPRVHDRYGRDRCALVAAFSTFQVRSAVRDFAKALGLPPGEIERLARQVDPWKDRNDIEGEVPAGGSPRWDSLVKLARDAWGLPRHMSQHPGGMVISTQPLIDLCPVQPASMEGRQMVQWDKDSCGDAGFLKIDLLGLGMLSAVERCIDEIARVRGERIDLSRIPYDDREVYARIQEAETTGVFQIESRAQMQMLKRTRPETLDDLTVQVALVRPGPIIGGAVHPYIEHRKALRADPDFEVPYEHPSLEPVLRDTLGTIVFQDQVLEVAMAFAGFTRGRGRGAAAGDEPAPLGGGDPRVRGEVHRGGDGAGRGAGGGRAGLDADRGLLRLRLPEGALGGVRAARLPVDLAAGALPPGVPVRAPERAADGLLPAGRAGARGAAARGGGPAAVRGPQHGRMPRREDGSVRMGLGYVTGVKGGARSRRDWRRASAARRLALARRPRRAVGRLRGDARPARLGGRVRRARRRRAVRQAAARALDARAWPCPASRWRPARSWRSRSIPTRAPSCAR